MSPDLTRVIAQAEADGDWVTAGQLKAAQHAENIRNTDHNGRLTVPAPTDHETRREAVRRQLNQAIDHGDSDTIRILSDHLAQMPANEAPESARLSADQGSRTPPPGPPGLGTALADAEEAGDTTAVIYLKTQQALQTNRNHLPPPEAS